jgi:hypothetical protein
MGAGGSGPPAEDPAETARKEEAAREAQRQREQLWKEQAAREQAMREQSQRDIEQRQRERQAWENQERVRIAQEQAERVRLANEEAERQRLARERADREQFLREQQARYKAVISAHETEVNGREILFNQLREDRVKEVIQKIDANPNASEQLDKEFSIIDRAIYAIILKSRRMNEQHVTNLDSLNQGTIDAYINKPADKNKIVQEYEAKVLEKKEEFDQKQRAIFLEIKAASVIARSPAPAPAPAPAPSAFSSFVLSPPPAPYIPAAAQCPELTCFNPLDSPYTSAPASYSEDDLNPNAGRAARKAINNPYDNEGPAAYNSETNLDF